MGNLYPYYLSKDQLPLSAWGYLFDPADPKKPIFWPTSMEYFQQFTKFLNRMGVIGHFEKVQKTVNGVAKTELIAHKLMRIEPTYKIKQKKEPEK